MVQLPIAQFPDIAPPEVQLSATYIGADALTIEQSVATPIEQQMSGVDRLDLHVLDQRQQRHDDAARRLRRRHQHQHRPDPGPDALRAGAVAAPVRRPAVRRDHQAVDDGPARAVLDLLAEGHLRRALPHQLRLHQHQRPDDPRARRRAGADLRRRPVRDADVGAARHAGQARHHGHRDHRRDQAAEHGEPGRPDRRRAGAARPGVHLHGARPGPARSRPRSSRTSSSARTPTAR